MRSSVLLVLAASAISLSACNAHARTTAKPGVPAYTGLPGPAKPQPEIAPANDTHRMWWNTYHPGQNYDPAVAIPAHRAFCEDHPSDSTCIGWDWR